MKQSLVERPLSLWAIAKKNRTLYKWLRRHIARKVAEGAEDPRDADGKTTLSHLYECIPSLRPKKDQNALTAVRLWFLRNEERIHEIAREEAELALRRVGIDPTGADHH